MLKVHIHNFSRILKGGVVISLIFPEGSGCLACLQNRFWICMCNNYINYILIYCIYTYKIYTLEVHHVNHFFTFVGGNEFHGAIKSILGRVGLPSAAMFWNATSKLCSWRRNARTSCYQLHGFSLVAHAARFHDVRHASTDQFVMESWG